ncbi:GNAT family N-acetyltransferase [Chloroflexales bacterium ZM16-3]|nr:GNAT family N-acetyltransferase [Chloroflexales bacterium ZM16-3]
MQFINKVTDDFWWEVASKCSYATFYHTPIWKEIAERSFPSQYRNETFGAILPSGARVVFPLMSSRRIGPLRWLESTFAGCYGGFIADGPISSAEADQIYKQVCSYSTYSFLVLENPIGPPLPDAIKAQLSLVVNEESYTIPLDGDFDSILARFSRSRRTSYRSSFRKGVRIRLATSIDDYRAYYDTYRDAVDRWGKDESYGYQWGVFEQIYQLSQLFPEQIKLWLIIADERIVGGRLFFYWNQHVAFWTGTAHRDYLYQNVLPLADTEIIRDAVAHGFRYFDFNTSSHDDGLITYKKRFGAKAIPINVWRFENPILKPAQMLYWRLTARSSRAAPAPVASE